MKKKSDSKHREPQTHNLLHLQTPKTKLILSDHGDLMKKEWLFECIDAFIMKSKHHSLSSHTDHEITEKVTDCT